MAANILTHRKLPAGTYLLVVHTDTSKTLGDGTPDPGYVRTFEWGDKPDDTTAAEYVQMQLREAKALLVAEAQSRAAGTKLPSEGTTL